MKIQKIASALMLLYMAFAFGACETSDEGGGAAVTVPSAPQAAIVRVADKQLVLTWTAVNGAASYEVWYCKKDDTSTTAQSGGDINGTGHTITGLTSGTAYSVWLKAKNSAGTSDSGPLVSRTVPPVGAIYIYTADDLNNVRNNLTAYYVIMADIDLSGYASGEGWEPVGTAIKNSDTTTTFTGTLDGNGHVISNLTINRPDAPDYHYQGLFGCIGPEGSVINLGIEGGRVIGEDFVGSLVGYIQGGSLKNCYATMNVEGGHHVGGLAGFSNMHGVSGSIENCYATGSVKGENYIGGLIGENTITIRNCYATGNVEGIIQRIGGLVGNNFGSIINSYATGNVQGGKIGIGGLAGTSGSGTISNSYATGIVKGDNRIGGLVGCTDSYITSISNSYATGNVEGLIYVGGLVGNSGNKPIENCYSTGEVKGTDYIGGLVGYGGNNISNSYWDTITSGQSTSAGGEGKTTEEMKEPSTFSAWDFALIWSIDSSVNSGYPYLTDNSPLP